MFDLPVLPDGYYWSVYSEERIFGPAVTAKVKRRKFGIPITVSRGSGYLTSLRGKHTYEEALKFAVNDAMYLFRQKD